MHARQGGVALITAMVIVSVVMMAAVAMASGQRLEIRRLDNILGAARGESIVAQTELLAQNLLLEDQARSGFDALDEPWAATTLAKNEPGADARGDLADLHGRFNLNNLAPGVLGGRAPATVGPRAAGQTQPQSQSLSQRATTPRRMTPQRTPARANGNAAVQSGGPAPATGTAAATDAGTAPAPAAASADTRPLSELPPRDEWTRDEYVEALSRVYDTACSARGQTAEGCEDAFADNVNPDLANAAVERAIARAAGDIDGDFSTTGSAPQATVGGGQIAAVTAPGAAGGAAGRSGLAARPGTNPRSAPTDSTAHTVPSAARAAGGTTELDAAIRFRLLLEALDIDTAIAQAILDWLDADTDTRFPNGAEDDYYLELETPYRTANRALADVRELRLVRGVDDEVFARLAPHVTVLPERTDINVNTATPEVLMSLAPGFSRTLADRVVASRKVQPFQTVQQFVDFMQISGVRIGGQGIAVTSDYFALTSRYSSGRLAAAARSLLHRGARTVAVIRRELGYYP